MFKQECAWDAHVNLFRDLAGATYSVIVQAVLCILLDPNPVDQVEIVTLDKFGRDPVLTCRSLVYLVHTRRLYLVKCTAFAHDELNSFGFMFDNS